MRMKAAMGTMRITTTKQPEPELAFARRAFGGYDPKEVDQTVDRLTARLEALDRKNGEMHREYEERLREVYAYVRQIEAERDAERLQIAEVMTAARADAANVMEQTRGKAEKLAKRAWEEAERVLSSAQKTAELTVAGAEREAQAMLADARQEAEAVRAQTQALLRQFSGFALSAKQTLQDIEDKAIVFSGLCPELPENCAFSQEAQVLHDGGARETNADG
jgi:cell division septum initiation protein DivIVA